MAADVTLENLREAYPYDGKIYRLNMSGRQLKRGIAHMMRPEVLEDWKETFFHFSRRLKIDFDFDSKELSVEFDGLPLEDDRILTVGMQEYYLANSDIGFGISPEELTGGTDRRRRGGMYRYTGRIHDFEGLFIRASQAGQAHRQQMCHKGKGRRFCP